MRHIVRNTILILILGFISLTYSCSKEEPMVVDESATYTIRGRITPINGNSDSVWANVSVSIIKVYDSFTLNVEYIDGQDSVITDSDGYFEINYTEYKKLDQLILVVNSSNLNTPYNLYCRLTPNCNLLDTNFYYDDDIIILQGVCKDI